MSTPGSGSVASSLRAGRPSSAANASHEAPTSASSSSRSGEASVTRPPAWGATSVLDVSSMRSTSLPPVGAGESLIGRSLGFLNSGRPDAHLFARVHAAGGHDAGEQAEVLAVLGREVLEQPGPLLLRVRVARRDRAALAGVVDAQAHSALELDLRALPAGLRPRLGVELEVEVGAEAARVDVRAELARERREAGRDGHQHRAGHVRD